MSVHVIYYQDGAKHMRPISSAEEYHKLRASAKQTETLKAARTGDIQAKRSLLQFNYSGLPNDDGTLKGSVRLSSSVGMDIDQEVDVVSILSKQEELGLLFKMGKEALGLDDATMIGLLVEGIRYGISRGFVPSTTSIS